MGTQDRVEVKSDNGTKELPIPTNPANNNPIKIENPDRTPLRGEFHLKGGAYELKLEPNSFVRVASDSYSESNDRVSFILPENDASKYIYQFGQIDVFKSLVLRRADDKTIVSAALYTDAISEIIPPKFFTPDGNEVTRSIVRDDTGRDNFFGGNTNDGSYIQSSTYQPVVKPDPVAEISKMSPEERQQVAAALEQVAAALEKLGTAAKTTGSVNPSAELPKVKNEAALIPGN